MLDDIMVKNFSLHSEFSEELALEDKWLEILWASKNGNPAIAEAVERVIMLYELSKKT